MVQLRAPYVIGQYTHSLSTRKKSTTFYNVARGTTNTTFICDTLRKHYVLGIMTLSEPEIKQWVAITELLSREPIRSMLYARTRTAANARTHEAAEKRAEIWRELVKQGVSQTKIARAFGVTQQAVSKAIRDARFGARV